MARPGGQTLALIGEGMGVSLQHVKPLREIAFKDLRRDQRLRRALDDETLYYQHLGVNGFITSWTSITEKVELWRIEMRARLDNMRNVSEEGDNENHDKGAVS